MAGAPPRLRIAPRTEAQPARTMRRQRTPEAPETSRSVRARTRGAPRTNQAINVPGVEEARAPTITRVTELLENPSRGGRDDDSSSSEEDSPLNPAPGRERAASRVVRQNLQGWLNSQLGDELEHLTIGERESVTKPSLEKYGAELARFSAYTGVRRALDIPANQVDQRLIAYMETLLVAGAHPSQGCKLLAAMLMVRPELRRGNTPGIPRAWRSLKGWLKLVPPRSRTPVPFPVWAMVINGLTARGRRDMGIWILVALETYGRPGQVLALTHGQIHRPSPVCGSWTIVFNPEEAGIASKTGEYDTSVVMDGPRCREISPVLQELSKGAPTERIWRFDYLELYHHFRAVCKELGIHLVLYQTRHSGASRDAVEKRRTRAEIQKRGGWRSAKSVNRYEKSGRLSAAWDSLSPTLQQHALRCEAGLWETIAYGQVTAT
jgi:hypothetical protein